MAPRIGSASKAIKKTVASANRRMRDGAAKAIAIIETWATPVIIAVVRNGVPSWIEKSCEISRLIGALPKWKIMRVTAKRTRPLLPTRIEYPDGPGAPSSCASPRATLWLIRLGSIARTAMTVATAVRIISPVTPLTPNIKVAK